MNGLRSTTEMTIKRIIVKETEEFCMEQLEGKLEDVIAILQDWKNEEIC